MAGNLLLMTGHSRLLLYNSLAAVLLNLALAMLLIPRYGLLGAAIATAVSNFAISAAQLGEMRFTERYDVPTRSQARVIRAAMLPMAGVVAAYSGHASSLLSRMPARGEAEQRATWVGLMIALYALLVFLLPGTNPLRSLFRRGLPAVVASRDAA